MKMNKNQETTVNFITEDGDVAVFRVIEETKINGVKYLLVLDDIEDEEFTNESSDAAVKKINIEEANIYIEQRKKASWRIALATFLCILSPITLIAHPFPEPTIKREDKGR